MPKLVLERLDQSAAPAATSLAQIATELTLPMMLQILDTLPDPIGLKDRSHRWVTVNAAFCDYMGHERCELIGKSEHDLLPAPQACLAWDHDEAVFKTGHDDVVTQAFKADGDAMSRVQQIQRSLIRDANDEAFLLVVVRDVTGTETAQAMVRESSPAGSKMSLRPGKNNGEAPAHPARFAFADPLTQLPDRRAFMNLLDAAATRVSHSAAVFVINIDHFKLVNDRFGHMAGDSLILEVAGRLRTVMRTNDILGRLDSDEFVVLANDVDAMQADDIAEQMLAEVARPLTLDQQQYQVSISVGIAMLPDHGLGADELVRNARSAMSRRKHRSRGGSEFYCDAANSAAHRLTTIEFKLPLALENGEIAVHYQPVVRGGDHTVAGFEALARWRDPELGELAPVEFIPIAEGMGVIRRLGQAIFDQACGFAASLADPRMLVSVNVSGSQLMDETFPIFVAETLQKHAVTGDRIFLEMTESVAMDADSSVRRVFDQLSSLGVRLIVDDFGTGFSNLARLKQLPFAALKIDREFVRDLPDSPPDRAIFRATEAIARELNLRIVAEGVENPAQDEFVRAYGVDYVQGFLFGRPAPAEKLKRYTRC